MYHIIRCKKITSLTLKCIVTLAKNVIFAEGFYHAHKYI